MYVYYRDKQRSYTCTSTRYKDWEDIYLKRTNTNFKIPSYVDIEKTFNLDVLKKESLGNKDAYAALLMALHQTYAKEAILKQIEVANTVKKENKINLKYILI